MSRLTARARRARRTACREGEGARGYDGWPGEELVIEDEHGVLSSRRSSHSCPLGAVLSKERPDGVRLGRGHADPEPGGRVGGRLTLRSRILANRLVCLRLLVTSADTAH